MRDLKFEYAQVRQLWQTSGYSFRRLSHALEHADLLGEAVLDHSGEVVCVGECRPERASR